MKGLLGRALGCALVLLVAVAVLPAVARALEPPRPGELDRYVRDGSLATREAFAYKLGNDQVAPQLVQRLQGRLRAQVLGLDAPSMAPPLAYGGMPTTGTNKILVLCIDFSDYPAQTATATISDKVFGAGDSAQYPYESLHNFYQRSSYNQLDVQGSVLGWYRPAYTRASMAMTGTAREALIREALNYYNASVDYSQFDNNGDGKIDYFAVLWTGPDNGWANFWWGYQTSWYYNPRFSVDGVTPDTYSWQWERPWSGGVPAGSFTPRVMIHETGHALGLPDYYDYKSKAQGDTVGPDGGIGYYDMMSNGTGDHNAFSKWLLGWIAPPVVSWVTRTQTLGPSCTNQTGSALAVMPGLAAGNWNAEFFLVQNRNKVYDSNDRYMPGIHGLQIWHVDARLDGLGYDYLSNNSYTAHKLLRLQEADGLEEIEQNKLMNAGDYYIADSQFPTTGTPNSKTYVGTDTGIVVDTISELVRDVTFRVVGGYDHTAPVSTISGADSLWHNADVPLTFGRSDGGGSGILRTEYNVDSTGWTTGTSYTVLAPANHSNDGTHTVQYRSVDNAENLETAKQVSVKIDTQAPVSSVTNSDAMWHNQDVTLGFGSVDAGGSGLLRTEYNRDGLGWVTGAALLYTAASDHSHDGIHTVSYRGIDGAGNIESSPSCQIKMDTAGPTVSDDGDVLWHRSPYTVTVTAVDSLSGVAVVYFAVDGGDLQARTQTTIRTRRHKIGSGAHKLYYFALDTMNNHGLATIRNVYIDDEIPKTTTNFASGAVVTGPFTVVFTPHDRYSGVASAGIHYRIRLNGGIWGSWTTGAGGTIPAPPSGQYAGEILYYSVDRAGNAEATHTATLTVLHARRVPGLYLPPLPKG